jgi:RNA polymerase sigma-70 factor, ECF subfamily
MMMTATIAWLSEATPAAPAPASPGVNLASDEALMLEFREGDEKAFRLLYLRHRASLMRFCRNLTGNPHEAEEIFQETWIAVIGSRARYSVRARFVTFLFAIAHRRASDGWRRRARHPAATCAELADHSAAAGDEYDPPGVAMADERQRALHAAIATLPLEQRAVFLLRAETGLGLRDIAAMTGARAEATKSRLRYALRHLRKALVPWQ